MGDPLGYTNWHSSERRAEGSIRPSRPSSSAHARVAHGEQTAHAAARAMHGPVTAAHGAATAAHGAVTTVHAQAAAHGAATTVHGEATAAHAPERWLAPHTRPRQLRHSASLGGITGT